MTSREIDRAARRKEQHREGWAGLESVGFETRLIGSGEAWIGPILFGRAFAHPPQFSFSSIDGAGTVQSDLVRPLTWPHPRILPANDSMVWDGWICDAQFDTQMRYGDPYIPGLDEFKLWPGYQKIISEDDPNSPLMEIGFASFGGYADEGPGYGNWWVQAMGSGPRWSIVSGHPYDDGTRRPSTYSAEYVFETETESRGLYPIRPGNLLNPYFPARSGLDNEAYELGLWTCTYDSAVPNQYPMGPWLAVGTNPPLDKFTMQVALEASGPCQLEIYARHWDSGGEWDTGGGTSTSHRLLHEETQVFDLATGQNLVSGAFAVPSNYYPNYPATDDSVYVDGLRVMFRIRILGGVPGLRVNVQRSLLWPNMDDRISLPMVSLGVAEWIIDDNGAYIGANLWAKTRDPVAGTVTGSIETNPPPPCGFYRRVGDLYEPPVNNVNNGLLFEILDGHANPSFARYMVSGVGEFGGFVINDFRSWTPTIIQERTGGWQAEGNRLIQAGYVSSTALFYASQLACHTVNVTYFDETHAVYPPYSAVLIAGDLLRFGFDYSWTLTNNGVAIQAGDSGWNVQAWTLGKNALPPPEYNFNISGDKQADVTSQTAYSLSPGQSQTITGHVELEMMATEDRVAFVYAWPIATGFAEVSGGEITNMFLEVQGA